MDRKYHTLYIPLPKSQNDKLFNLFKTLIKVYPNTFLDEKTWMAHITLISLGLLDYDTSFFREKCKEALKDIKPFDISFDGLGLSQSGKFVVLNLSKGAETQLVNVKKHVDKTLAALIRDNIPAKYVKNWKDLSVRQQNLALTTGSKYEFIPHVSIIKLQRSDAKKALNTAKNYHCGKIGGFSVTEFKISCETGDTDKPFAYLDTIVI